MSWPNGYTWCTLFSFNVLPSANLTAFPNLILGTYLQFADVAHGGNVQHTTTLNGQTVPADLIFTSDAAGSVLLAWEIESWNNATGAIVAWVRSDRSSSVATSVYVWIGNSSVTTYQCSATATWDSDFSAVYHAPNGSTPSFNDSTLAGNTGTNHGVTAAAGEVDGAWAFSSVSSQYVALGNHNDIGATDFTLSTWVKAPNASQAGPILAKESAIGYIFGIGSINSGGQFVSSKNIFMFTWSGGSFDASHAQSYHTTADIIDGNWHHVVATRTSGTIAIYVDGVSVPLTADLANTTSLNTTNSINCNVGFWSTSYLNGNLDELRIASALSHPVAWIAHSYTQQSQLSPWYTVTDQYYTSPGVLTLVGHAPSLKITLAVPSAGVLTITGKLPNTVIGTVLSIPAGALTLTGHAPSLKITLANPSATLSLAGKSPTLKETLAVGKGALTLVGHAPILLNTPPLRFWPRARWN